jgi:hypothetical protein
MNINRIIKESLLLSEDGTRRTAEIFYNKMPNGVREFKKVLFSTNEQIYDLDDWRFLGCIANELECFRAENKAIFNGRAIHLKT